MKKVIKNSIWLTASVVALPAVAALGAITGDKKNVIKSADQVAKYAKKIGDNMSESAVKERLKEEE